MTWCQDPTLTQYILHSFCHIPAYITYWFSFSTLIRLFSLLLPIFCFRPPSAPCCGQNLTFVTIQCQDPKSTQYILPHTNLYYLSVQFQHSNQIIFVIIADFLFFTPLQLHFAPVFHIFVVLEPIFYLKSLCVRLLVSSPKLYYILERFWFSKFKICFNILMLRAFYWFWTSLGLASMALNISHFFQYRENLLLGHMPYAIMYILWQFQVYAGLSFEDISILVPKSAIFANVQN